MGAVENCGNIYEEVGVRVNDIRQWMEFLRVLFVVTFYKRKK